MNTFILSKLPPYAGIAEPEQTGLSVDECASFIVRFAAIKKRTVQMFAARMTGIPEWELKAATGRWMWEDATHYQDLERRVLELRSTRASIDKVLSYQLGDFLTEILHSPDSLVLCVGLFDVLSPAFCEAVENYLLKTNSLVDHPSVRVLKVILAEEQERLSMGKRFVDALAEAEGGSEIRRDWKNHFSDFLNGAGGILGNQPVSVQSLQPRAMEEFRMEREFKRDDRFATTIAKVSPEKFQGDDLRNMMWARSQEMTAAEMVATVIYEWENLPTDAIVDLTRHCWDEVRHSLFGQAALEQENIPFASVPNWVGYAKHTLPAPPPKRYAHLAIATEAGSMAYPGGKRGEWEFCKDKAKHPLMALYQDFDWADEVTHVNYGRKWLVEYHFKGDRLSARKVADETMLERKAFYSQFGDVDKLSSGY
jgi:hypothetical protein